MKPFSLLSLTFVPLLSCASLASVELLALLNLKNDKVLGSIDTLKAQGFNPNHIMLLPNHLRSEGFLHKG